MVWKIYKKGVAEFGIEELVDLGSRSRMVKKYSYLRIYS